MPASVKCEQPMMNTAKTNTNRSLRFPIVAAALMATAFCFTSAPTANSVHAAQAANNTAAAPTVHRQHWFQFGRASWYGHALQGLPTATGEAYDMNAMTCAHRTLPLGSLVRVTNLATRHVFYFRTFDHSSMAVAAVGVPVYTHFTVPAAAETGPSDLVVVANGIASKPVRITVR